MRIVRGLESYPPDAAPSAVALGAFDGVHLGHRAILGTAVAQARRNGLQALACTFDPHPLEVLQPERSPAPITTLEERLELIAETGIDTTLVVVFTRAVAAVQAEEFVSRVLVGRCGRGTSSSASTIASATAPAATPRYSSGSGGTLDSGRTRLPR